MAYWIDQYMPIPLNILAGLVMFVAWTLWTPLGYRISSLWKNLATSILMVIYGVGAVVVINFITCYAPTTLLLLCMITVAPNNAKKKVFYHVVKVVQKVVSSGEQASNEKIYFSRPKRSIRTKNGRRGRTGGSSHPGARIAATRGKKNRNGLKGTWLVPSS